MIPAASLNSLEARRVPDGCFSRRHRKPFNLRLPAPFDEIFLKRNYAFWSLNSGLDAIVGHRKNSGSDVEVFPQSVRNIGELEPFAQQARPRDVCGDIFIAELEPRFAPKFFQLLQGRESVSLDSQPCSGSLKPASAYIIVSRSGKY